MTNTPENGESATAGRGDRRLSAALWALLALVLGGIGFLVLGACGIGWLGGGLAYCPPPPVPDARAATLDEIRSRHAVLEDRLARLRLQLAAAPACPIPEPEPEEVAEAPEPAPDIPEEAWEDRDIGLLEGCWERVTNMSVQDVNTGETTGVREWRICFDESGRGVQSLVYDNGNTCEGPVTAEFLEDGRMRITDEDDLACTNDTFVYRSIYICERLPDGTARCVGSQPEIDRHGLPSLFRR